MERLSRSPFNLLFILSLAGVGIACSDPGSDPAPRILSFAADPSELSSPGETTLSWSTADARAVSLHQDGVALEPASLPASGSLQATISKSSVFELRVQGADRTATQQLTVTLRGSRPGIGSFKAPTLVGVDELGTARATLEWSGVLDATEVVIESNTLDPISLEPDRWPDGELEIEIVEDTVFTLIARNEWGEAREEASVRVVALPTIALFEVERPWIGLGESTKVRWEVLGASQIELWVNGVREELDPARTQGSLELVLFQDAELLLRAYDEVGGESSQHLEVQVGTPRIDAFAGSDRGRWLGQVLTLSWATQGGGDLEILASGSEEPICATSDRSLVEAATCDVAGLALSHHSFTLLVSNGSGVTSEVWEIFVGAGPTIEAFSARPEAVTLGEPLTIRWSAHPDPLGELPTLSLIDDRGGVHPIPTAEGELELIPTQLGRYEFSLEASTSHPLSLPASASANVGVYGPPAVTLEATPTHFDEDESEDVMLRWTSEHAASLVLYRLRPETEALELLQIPEAERASGSLHLVPDDDASYRLVARNGAGAEVFDDAEVHLAPPQVRSFQAEPAEILAGESVLLRWETHMAGEVSLSILERPYLLEETSAPYLDLKSLSGDHLPMTAACSPGSAPSIGAEGCADLAFPGGFVFPFDGIDRSAVRVYGNGVLSFDMENLVPGVATNAPFPTALPALRFVHLAPFWDAMAWDPDRHPNGNVRYLFREEEPRSLIIGWDELGFADDPQRSETSLGFEVILWENGDFEYRYGRMEAGEAPSIWANGGAATIGFQTPSQSTFELLNHNDNVRPRGPLHQRSFSFRRTPSIARSGSLRWSPYATAETNRVELVAFRGEQRDSEQLEVQVLQRPAIEITQRPRDPILVGEPFRVGWTTDAATSLEILNDAGQQVCQAQSAAAVAEGFCNIEEEDEAVHTYRIRAGGARGSSVEKRFEVRAHHPFGIERFEADQEAVEIGHGVELSWVTTNAHGLRLLANGAELFDDGAPSDAGSFAIPSLEEDTTFTLQVTNSIGMRAEQQLIVELWEVKVDLVATATTVRPGTTVTVEIEATALEGGPAPTLFGTFPLEEQLDEASEYQDISVLPDAQSHPVSPTDTSSVVDVSFPPGFSFPYFGVEETGARVFADGYLSFDPQASVETFNRRLPGSSGAMSSVHLAPFWDDLYPYYFGEIWTAALGPNTFVIQWSKMSLSLGSSWLNPHDLNFQVVLHRSGSFEYRYGRMDPLQAPKTSSACFPHTCREEANGASATIGFQNQAGTAGLTLHFGGTDNGPANLSFPGGLSHRSFRSDPRAGSASLIQALTETASYGFCTHSGQTPICKELQIVVDFGIERFDAASTSLSFGDATTLSWKTRGGDELIIRDGASVLLSTTDRAAIEEGNLQVEPVANATYVAELRATGREERATLSVQVIRMELRAAVSSTNVDPGDPVTLSWTLDNRDPAAKPVIIKPMEEVMNLPFSSLDIAGDPNAIEIFGAGVAQRMVPHQLMGGFVFNHLGQEMSQVNVSSKGYLSFDPTATNTTGTNQLLPNSAPGLFRQAHLVPFWDDLHTRRSGRVLAKKVSEEIYVIQWSHMSLNYGSHDQSEGDLNFMIVLHRSGDFEFRYGRMAPPPAPVLSGCAPLSCALESAGSSATIGYQHVSGSFGSLTHFGGVNAPARPWPVVGGLAERTWRFTRTATSGSLQVHPADTSTYRICIVDADTQDSLCAAPLEVRAPWGISSFEASPAPVVRGEEVILSWEIAGLDRFELKADSAVIATYGLGGQPLSPSGSFAHTPSATTTYSLEGESLGRTVVRERTVEFRAFTLDIEVPAGRVFPGDQVSIDWELIQHEPGDFSMTSPMFELAAGPGDPGEYRDIRGLPGAAEAPLSPDATFRDHAMITLPFTFPYFGGGYTEVQAFIQGYLGLQQGLVKGTPANTPLPSDAAGSRIHLAAFWDDLSMGTSGEIWTYHPDPFTVIIQYSNLTRAWDPETASYDLNFQIVLFSDGSFEYRYGTMAPPAPPFSSGDCYPVSCALEANGSSATIGYQTLDGGSGQLVHFGGERREGVLPLPGGLGGRSFRFESSKTGSTSFTIERGRAIDICAVVGTFRECGVAKVETVADPGDLMITELMIDPAGGVSQQWFELRNLSDKSIDIEGFVLSTVSGSHTVRGSLPMVPGSFITLASSAAPGFGPDYVYGSELILDPAVDRLEIRAGTATITSVGWGISWMVPAGRSLSLDPSFHRPGAVSNDDFDRWCDAEAGTSPGAIGRGCVSPFYDVEPLSPLPFLDISGIGTKPPQMEGMNLIAEIPLPPFPLQFFREDVGKIWVGSNGWISFATANPGGGATTAPLSLPRSPTDLPTGPLVSAFWDSLICYSFVFDCSFRHHHLVSDEGEALVLQWTGFRTVSNLTAGSLTFQIQLWRDGRIVVAFDEADSGQPAWSAIGQQYNGGTAWIGIEGPPGELLTAHHRRVTNLSHRSFEFRPK